MPKDVGMAGENAAGILASDATRNQRRLINIINEELSSSLPGWVLDVTEPEQGSQYAIGLRSTDDPTLRVNIVDTGTGVAQALPIFVQRAMDISNPPRDPVLEIVEQPELHLHPAAHGALADLYLEATKNTRVRFLIETHSETFLLRLRRRVAEGRFDPGLLSIYYVENHDGKASAKRINVDENGGLDYWPEGVFSEDYEETKSLAKAQMSRMGLAAR